jgi:hypothetical protein
MEPKISIFNQLKSKAEKTGKLKIVETFFFPLLRTPPHVAADPERTQSDTRSRQDPGAWHQEMCSREYSVTDNKRLPYHRHAATTLPFDIRVAGS